MVDYYITFKDKPFNLAEVQYSVLSSPKHESENRRDEPTLVQGTEHGTFLYIIFDHVLPMI